MPRRRKVPVSLAPVGQNGPPDVRAAVATADAALRKFKTIGHRASAGPTPERLVQAGGNADVRLVAEVVEVSRGNRFESETVDIAQVNVAGDPFSVLCRRKLMDPDKGRNFALCMAGVRYRQAWRSAGLEGVRSVNLDRVGGSGSGGLFASEAAAAGFSLFRKLKEAVNPDFRAAVDAIVLADREPVDVGRQIGAYRAETQARAVALFVLRRGLAAMATKLGLLDVESQAPRQPIAAE